MAAPLQEIQQTMTSTVTSCFLDDRVSSVPTAQDAINLLNLWHKWTTRYELHENEKKMAIVPSNVAQTRQLCRLGIKADNITDNCRVLGVDFCQRADSTFRPTIAQRHTVAVQCAQRLRQLPVSASTRRSWWRSAIVPRASWGMGLCLPRPKDCKKLRRVFKHCLQIHHMASMHLVELLEGHWHNFAFAAGVAAVQTPWRVFCNPPNSIHWYETPKVGAWLFETQQWLSNLGWNPTSPWHWTHETCGSMHWQQPVGQSRPKKFPSADAIRESWRRQHFCAFLAQPRRDSAMLQEVEYDEKITSMTRKIYTRSSAHGRAVMTGAANSTAVDGKNF